MVRFFPGVGLSCQGDQISGGDAFLAGSFHGDCLNSEGWKVNPEEQGSRHLEGLACLGLNRADGSSLFFVFG